MTADVEFVIGDGGSNYDINLVDADGNTLDTSSYTGATMYFSDLTYGTLLKTITLTFASNGVGRWAMTTSDTNITLETGMTSRLMAGQIKLTGSGLVTYTKEFSVYASSKLQ
jgi:hypothetical protein